MERSWPSLRRTSRFECGGWPTPRTVKRSRFPPRPRTWPCHRRARALSRDGAHLAAAAGKQVKLWTVADGKELQTFPHPAEVISVGFNANRSRLATGATDNLARVFDLAKNYEVQAFSHGAAVQ